MNNDEQIREAARNMVRGCQVQMYNIFNALNPNKPVVFKNYAEFKKFMEEQIEAGIAWRDENSFRNRGGW